MGGAIAIPSTDEDRKLHSGLLFIRLQMPRLFFWAEIYQEELTHLPGARLPLIPWLAPKIIEYKLFPE